MNIPNITHNRRLKGPQRKRIRKYLLSRDGSKCWICFQHILPEYMTIDHVEPFSDKKPNVNRIENLRLACRWCNESRTWDAKTTLKMLALTEEQRRKKFICREVGTCTILR